MGGGRFTAISLQIKGIKYGKKPVWCGEVEWHCHHQLETRSSTYYTIPILASRRWKDWPVVILCLVARNGHRHWRSTQGMSVTCVSNHSSHPQRHNCTPRNGRNIPGPGWTFDYAGPCEGHMFLILVDAHSKWIKYSQLSKPIPSLLSRSSGLFSLLMSCHMTQIL